MTEVRVAGCPLRAGLCPSSVLQSLVSLSDQNSLELGRFSTYIWVVWVIVVFLRGPTGLPL